MSSQPPFLLPLSFTTSSPSYSSPFALVYHPFDKSLRRQTGNSLLTVHTRAPGAGGVTYKVAKGVEKVLGKGVDGHKGMKVGEKEEWRKRRREGERIRKYY